MKYYLLLVNVSIYIATAIAIAIAVENYDAAESKECSQPECCSPKVYGYLLEGETGR